MRREWASDFLSLSKTCSDWLGKSVTVLTKSSVRSTNPRSARSFVAVVFWFERRTTSGAEYRPGRPANSDVAPRPPQT